MVSVSDIFDAYVLSILHPLMRTQVTSGMQTTGQSALVVLKSKLPLTSVATNADDLLEESGISLVKGANYYATADMWLRTRIGSWPDVLEMAILRNGQHPQVVNPVSPVLPTLVNPTRPSMYLSPQAIQDCGRTVK